MLIDKAIAILQQVMPEGWSLTRQQTGNAAGQDVGLSLQPPGRSFSIFLAEARTNASPRDIQQLASRLTQRMRAYTSVDLLFIAPWISARSRELLVEGGWSYIDLTGNIRISIPNSAVFVDREGAQNDPAPRRRGTIQLRGARSGRLIRFLCDVRPPYRVRELATATGINMG